MKSTSEKITMPSSNWILCFSAEFFFFSGTGVVLSLVNWIIFFCPTFLANKRNIFHKSSLPSEWWVRMSHQFEMFTQFGGLSDTNRFRARFEPKKWISISLKRETREKSVVAISVDFELYKTRNIDQMNLDQNQNLRENGTYGSPRFTRQRFIFN